MNHYNFIASDNFDLNHFNEVGNFVDAYPDFQTVFLKNDEELNMLLGLLGIVDSPIIEIPSLNFPKYWDLSEVKLPGLSEDRFEIFFDLWTSTSGRKKDMDEYGQLIFLKKFPDHWNTRKYRMVVKETGDGF